MAMPEMLLDALLEPLALPRFMPSIAIVILKPTCSQRSCSCRARRFLPTVALVWLERFGDQKLRKIRLREYQPEMGSMQDRKQVCHCCIEKSIRVDDLTESSESAE